MDSCAKCKVERLNGESRCPQCGSPYSHYSPGQKLRFGEYLLQEAVVFGEREIVWKAKRVHGKEESDVEIRELAPLPGEGEAALARFKPWLKACRTAGDALPEVLDGFTVRGHVVTVWARETAPSLRDRALGAPLTLPEIEAIWRSSLKSLAVLQKKDGDFRHGAIQADTIHVLSFGAVRFAPPSLTAFGVDGKAADLSLLAKSFHEAVPISWRETGSGGLEAEGWRESPIRAALEACESVSVPSAEAALSFTQLAEKGREREKSGAPAEALELYRQAAKFAGVPALKDAIERCRPSGGEIPKDEAAASGMPTEEKVGGPPAAAEMMEERQLPVPARVPVVQDPVVETGAPTATVEEQQLSAPAPVPVEQEPVVEAPAATAAPEEPPPSGTVDPQHEPDKKEEVRETAVAEAAGEPASVRGPVREAEGTQAKTATPAAPLATGKPTTVPAPVPAPKPKTAVADGGTVTPPARSAPRPTQPVLAPPQAPAHAAPPAVKPGTQPLSAPVPKTTSPPPPPLTAPQPEAAKVTQDLPKAPPKTGPASPHRTKWKQFVTVGALVVAGVAGIIVWEGWPSPVGEYRRLLDSGQLVCNAQTALCAHAVYRKTVETKGPNSGAVREMAALAAPKLSDRIRKDLDLLYSGGALPNWLESSAIAKWKEEIEPSDQTRAQSLFFQGMEQMNDNRLVTAVESFDAANALSPKWAVPKNFKGRALYSENSPKEAAKAYEEAAFLDSGWPEPLLNLGNLYTEANDLDNAAKQFRRALAIHDNLLVAHYFLGVVYHLKGPQFYQMSCESLRLATDTTGARTLDDNILKYANDLKRVVCRQ